MWRVQSQSNAALGGTYSGMYQRQLIQKADAKGETLKRVWQRNGGEFIHEAEVAADSRVNTEHRARGR